MGKGVQATAGKVPVEELPPDVRERLGLGEDGKREYKMVKPSIIALGGVLQSLKGLTNRQALWVLRQSTILVRGYQRDKNRNPETTSAGRRKKIIDDCQ